MGFRIETVLCDQHNLSNGWITRHQSIIAQACRRCHHQVISITGSISAATIDHFPPFITGNPGAWQWNNTGLCELCFDSVFEGHSVRWIMSPAHRKVLVYCPPGTQDWQLVPEPSGKLPDFSPLPENIVVVVR